MGAVMNGMAMHGGVLPFGGTFFVFSDYMRPSVRLAAISRPRSSSASSHDSVGLGEDGPTHQPVEQLAALRAMPGLRVIRPADANETVARRGASRSSRTGPTALIAVAARTLPVLDGTVDKAAGVAKGAYVLAWSAEDPDIILVGTGSEVHVCVDAADLLAAEGVVARVVSMPSWELFEAGRRRLPASRCSRPPSRPSRSRPAHRSAGSAGPTTASTFDHFGASAPGDVALEQLGLHAGATSPSEPASCSTSSRRPRRRRRWTETRSCDDQAP